LQITAEHRTAAKQFVKAQQKAQQSMQDKGRNSGTVNSECPEFSIEDTQMSVPLMGVEGLEPPTLSV
jgi:hypothetical protein